MRALLSLALVASIARLAPAQNLSDTQLDAVQDNLWVAAQQTWELGTEAEALLESDAPAYSVFANLTLPPPSSNSFSGAYNHTALTPVLQIAYNVASNRSNTTDPQPIMYVSGGAAGDPASLGVAVLLANWTGATEPQIGQSEEADYPGGTVIGRGVSYARAAEDQLEYLLQVVPRTSDGAISHRIEQVQLWADSVYMVPPFLAYYGVMTNNQSLVSEAYNQIKLYRSYLFDSKYSLWQHILMGDTNIDHGFWSTGNAWAAAGMLRVLATIQHSQYASSMASEMSNLTDWVKEIHEGMYKYQDSGTSLFHNYANTSTSFLDGSSTALLTSTVYRLALLQNVYTHLPAAERSREALSSSTSGADNASAYETWGTGDGVGPATSFTRTQSRASVSTSTSFVLNVSAAATAVSTSATSSYAVATPSAGVGAGLAHFSPEMWLTPVVDPYDWDAQGGSSPEGQAFVVEMYAAWRDWVQAGAVGANGGARVSAGGGVWAVVVAVGVGLVVGVW